MTPSNGPSATPRPAEVQPERSAPQESVTVGDLLHRLPARERRILALRFHGNSTQAEIATQLGLSQVDASRLLARALSRLREAMLSDAPQCWRAAAELPDGHRVTVETRICAEGALVDVAGEVDRDTAGSFRDALQHAVRLPVNQVLVNLTRVPFIDAAGVAALSTGLEAARIAGVRLRVAGAQPYVRLALRVTGLRAILDDGAT